MPHRVVPKRLLRKSELYEYNTHLECPYNCSCVRQKNVCRTGAIPQWHTVLLYGPRNWKVAVVWQARDVHDKT
jgi:hypothetical protein